MDKCISMLGESVSAVAVQNIRSCDPVQECVFVSPEWSVLCLREEYARVAKFTRVSVAVHILSVCFVVCKSSIMNNSHFVAMIDIITKTIWKGSVCFSSQVNPPVREAKRGTQSRTWKQKPWSEEDHWLVFFGSLLLVCSATFLTWTRPMCLEQHRAQWVGPSFPDSN